MRPSDRALTRSILHRARQAPRAIVTYVLAGFVIGLAYRLAFNPTAERSVSNFLLSGLHGFGLALTAWIVQASFASAARSSLGGALRRLPLAGEVVVRALAMTATLVVAGLALQFVLYAESWPLSGLNWHWLTIDLPRIVAVVFALSLVAGVVAEAGRLIGGQMLMSVVLGTYLRPARQPLIVMFLDLANSTSLAEALGEVRVHDLITRFFYDIDETITDFGGSVHSYVGDEVIVTWPIVRDPTLNARAVECFFAIKLKLDRAEPQYSAEFGVTPSFRAGIHAGPVIVSECGDTKRQLAYFGDTMNVAARLCDYCKGIDESLVVSGDLMQIIALRDEFTASAAKRIHLRGRQAPTDALVIGDRRAARSPGAR